MSNDDLQGVLIFVLDRGFVVVGDYRPHPGRAFYWHAARSLTVRRWGTSKGLAELADGPLDGTVLDQVVERSTPERSVIDIIHPSPQGVLAWRQVLDGSTPRGRKRPG